MHSMAEKKVPKRIGHNMIVSTPEKQKVRYEQKAAFEIAKEK